MKAELLVDRRTAITAAGFAEMVLWRVPQPVKGCAHNYKYRLAYVVKGVCVLRFDNEAGKGDHKHVSGVESPLAFTNPDALKADFINDVMRWNNENGHS
ncbi:MAG: DUF6516 family protein [Pseudomonadales bacterium]|jgi:hypothetical protein|nr:DUF6516 family protein [Pseudomonadales bacterium]